MLPPMVVTFSLDPDGNPPLSFSGWRGHGQAALGAELTASLAALLGWGHWDCCGACLTSWLSLDSSVCLNSGILGTSVSLMLWRLHPCCYLAAEAQGLRPLFLNWAFLSLNLSRPDKVRGVISWPIGWWNTSWCGFERSRCCLCGLLDLDFTVGDDMGTAESLEPDSIQLDCLEVVWYWAST